MPSVCISRVLSHSPSWVTRLIRYHDVDLFVLIDDVDAVSVIWFFRLAFGPV